MMGEILEHGMVAGHTLLGHNVRRSGQLALPFVREGTELADLGAPRPPALKR